jgi:hypothetical protein
MGLSGTVCFAPCACKVETKDEQVKASANTRDQRNKQQLRMKDLGHLPVSRADTSEATQNRLPARELDHFGKNRFLDGRTEGTLERYNLLSTAALAERRSEQKWIVFSLA